MSKISFKVPVGAGKAMVSVIVGTEKLKLLFVIFPSRVSAIVPRTILSKVAGRKIPFPIEMRGLALAVEQAKKPNSVMVIVCSVLCRTMGVSLSERHLNKLRHNCKLIKFNYIETVYKD